jgi:hypothetical protein
MLCKQQLGDYMAMDNQLVSMSHPDAMNALIANTEVSAHFATPPYLQEELKSGMHIIADGEDIAGAQFTFISGVAMERFYEEYPEVYGAFIETLNEAIAYINENTDEAIRILAPLYGLSEEEYAKIKPIDFFHDGGIDEQTVQKVLDLVEERSGSAPNMIICSYGVRRALINYFTSMGTRMQPMDIEGGHKSISFNGIPIVADRFCPYGTMYLINTDDFKLCQLGDWQWMESEDGKILHQIPGKPVYTATLVKYAELLCTRPNGQARITGIEE